MSTFGKVEYNTWIPEKIAILRRVGDYRNMSRATRIFISCLFLLGTAFALSQVCIGKSFANEAQGPIGIEDISSKWNFIDIGDYKHGDLFTDGKYKILCVETADQNFHLWNPILGTLSPPSKEQYDQ